MELGYMSVYDVSQKWNISVRRVQELCKTGKIEGAIRFGKSWMIPKDAKKPIDRRKKREKHKTMAQEISISAPLFTMTTMYSTLGKLSNISRKLRSNSVARSLFDAEMAYLKADFSFVKEYVNNFNPQNKDISILMGTWFLKSMYAFWTGDTLMWTEARKQISLIATVSEEEEKVVSLTLASLDILAYNNGSFPDWFERGCLEVLPKEVYPFAQVYYARLLYMVAVGVASKQNEIEGITGLALMKVINNAIEPLIAQAVVEKWVVPEICLRLTCATVYHNSGLHDLAIGHIDKALELALQDRLYLILLEYWRQLDHLLEQRIAMIDEQTAKKLKDLFKELADGANKTRSFVRNRKVATNLTKREREVAKFVSFGFTNKQIAKRLSIGESTVKSTIQNIMNKTGVKERSDIAMVL